MNKRLGLETIVYAMPWSTVYQCTMQKCKISEMRCSSIYAGTTHFAIPLPVATDGNGPPQRHRRRNRAHFRLASIAFRMPNVFSSFRSLMSVFFFALQTEEKRKDNNKRRHSNQCIQWEWTVEWISIVMTALKRQNSQKAMGQPLDRRDLDDQKFDFPSDAWGGGGANINVSPSWYECLTLNGK